MIKLNYCSGLHVYIYIRWKLVFPAAAWLPPCAKADGCAVTRDGGAESVHHHQTAPDNKPARPVG